MTTTLLTENEQPRLANRDAAPEVLPAMMALQQAANSSNLEQSLLELIKLRCSQINGCAFCIDMHFRDAKKHGESDERLFLLDAWREAPVYSKRERAGLAWAEALTRLSGGVPTKFLSRLATRLPSPNWFG